MGMAAKNLGSGIEPLQWGPRAHLPLVRGSGGEASEADDSLAIYSTFFTFN